ncbi:MAG: guanylate kinase [Planctomycetes bacterium]|nr:guanylate kinase [Planctomycetota bacterium]
MATVPRGKLIIVSGPSGAGKTSVLRRVFAETSVPLVASVSATTRPPRAGEVDGVDYRFLTPEEFDRRRRQDEFIECFEVFGSGYWYGTLESEVTPGLDAGEWVVLEIDVQGAMAVLERFPDALSFFIRTSSLDQLEQRLRGRGTESEEALKRRIDEARNELEFADRYRYQVINDDLDHAVREIRETLERLEKETQQDAR